MSPTTLTPSRPSRTAVTLPPGTLPRRMRVLFIATPHRRGAWLAEAFAADSAVEVAVEEAIGMAAGLARLRDEAFDVVFVSHEPGLLDGFDLAEALRSSGAEEPLILLGEQSEQELTPLAYEAGADGYVCLHTVTTRAVIWLAVRAVERHRLIRENRRLTHSEQHRLQTEHHETQRLLDEQRSLLRDLESFAAVGKNDDATAHTTSPAHVVADFPPMLVAHYHELMRGYVIMGSGNLGDDMGRIAELMADAEITAPETLQLHVCVLEEMVKGLGTRSSRHVMSRADLLVLEVMVNLSEVYRRRYFERRYPPRQLALPGFDDATIS